MTKRVTRADWAGVETWGADWTAIMGRFNASVARTRDLVARLAADCPAAEWQAALRAEAADWRQLLADFDALPRPKAAEGVRVRTLRLLGLLARAADDVDAWLQSGDQAHAAALFAKIAEAVDAADGVLRSGQRAIAEGETVLMQRERWQAAGTTPSARNSKGR